METVTGTVLWAGDIPVDNRRGGMETVSLSVLVQFDTAEDLKAAITSTKRVRLEWNTVEPDRPVADFTRSLELLDLAQALLTARESGPAMGKTAIEIRDFLRRVSPACTPSDGGSVSG